MKQGEIYLVKFPFTDLSSSKLRPALIISNASFNAHENIMLIGIFGNKGNTHYSRAILQEDLNTGKLNKKSFLRFHNSFSLHKSLIVKKVGSFHKDSLKNVIQEFSNFISIAE